LLIFELQLTRSIQSYTLDLNQRIQLYTKKGAVFMENDEFKDFSKDTHPRGHRHRKDHDHHHRGAKTFRRGRALAFLEMMNLKHSTLKQQLDAPEFQSIKQILIGELKALEMVINEFVQLFELHEVETLETNHEITEEEETSSIATKESLKSNEEKID